MSIGQSAVFVVDGLLKRSTLTSTEISTKELFGIVW